jgi:outer membrane protein
MNIRHIALLLAACFGSAAAQAADLLSLYRDAIAYDAKFASAKASLDAAREQLPQARAGLLPNVGLQASTTWYDTDTSVRTNPPFDVRRNYNGNGWTATLTQPTTRPSRT